MNKNNSIEVELRARAPEDLLSKLLEYEFSEQFEHDIYYKFPSQPENSWIARVRNRDSKYFLTYKSKKTFGEGAWSEVNIEVDERHAKQLHDFYLENDYFIEVEIKKLRKSFNIDGIELNVDQIEDLGLFVEAEVMTEGDDIDAAKDQIRQLFLSLGIKDEDILSKGYVALAKEAQVGKTQTR